MAYIPLPKAVEFLGLHPNTLRGYADEGKIKSITMRYLQTPATKANWKGVKTGIIQRLPEWCKDAPYQIK